MAEHLNISVFNNYPLINESEIDKLLKNEIEKDDTKFIVLDDDPTGVQTVHDISVYTDWTLDSIMKGVAEKNKVFYILTNSRGMTVDETTSVHKQIVKNIAKAAKETKKKYLIMSRSDSTLRGHYPLETQILKEGMEADGFHVDGEILCPFFKEGGRFTINNTHYVKYGEELVPAADTEFARDKSFGYMHSSIPEYVEEKTDGEYKARDVVCISLDTIRTLDFDKIEKQLEEVTGFQKVCVNAIDYCDIKIFAVALYRAMAKGKTFMFRTAAGLVKVVGGITDIPLLTRKDMVVNETMNGGIIVVGSHTQKTTDQLKELLKLDGVVPIEFNSNLVLDGDDALEAEVDRCIVLEEEIIKSGKTAVCFTNRTLLTVENDTKESALRRSVKISEGVQSLVGRLKVTPAFVIAKGGITSSDIGTKALAVQCAKVMGQIKPGIPVWQTGKESKFPYTPYVIFPGNVGETVTLRESAEILMGK